MIKSWLLAAGAMFTAAVVVSPWYLIDEASFFVATIALTLYIYGKQWVKW